MFTFRNEFIKFHHFTSRKIFFQIKEFVFVYSPIPFPNSRQLQRNWGQSLSCVWLCDSIDSSTPGSPVHHQLQSLLKLMFIESVMPSNHVILCRPFLLPPLIFPSIRVFSSESALRIRWPSIGVSASTSVLPMNIRDWFPLGWTSWILVGYFWL